LRHRPDEIGIALDEQGWVAIDELLVACAAHGRPIAREELEAVVATSDKRRFAVSDDGLRIRASQGHSVEVDLGYAPAEPPERLYHGTATRNLASIRAEGLNKGSRHHVHLSSDDATARSVGARYGKPIVLTIRAGEMARDGFPFYLSANGVWLTDHVPVRYVDEPST
jgi:putative RNA 2'-phosphotransferase